MQAQTSLGLWEFVMFWVFTGSGLLGLPPGDRDLTLLKAVPPQTLAYFEWSARAAGKAGAPGIDGFAADPEIRQFFELLDTELAKHEASDDDDPAQEMRSEMPKLAKLITAHSGCLFLGFEPKPQNTPGIEGWLNALTGLHGGAILNTGDDSDAVWKSLIRLLETLPDFKNEESSSTQTIPVSMPGYQLKLHRENSRILFALGEGTLPRMIDGLNGRLPGLDTNPRFRQAIERVAIPRMATIGWIDGQGIVASVAAALGPLGGLVKPMLTLVGADALDHVVQSSGVENGAMLHRTFIATGGRTGGVMVFAAGQPIQPQQFSHIPADADLVVATSVSLSSVYREARELLSKTQPLSVRVFDEAVKQLEAELELKIVDDVLPAFGDVVTIFDSPAAGGMIATSLMASLEVRSPQKAKLVFERMMKLAEQSLSVDHTGIYEASASFRSQQFLGHTIYYVNNPGSGFGSHLSTTPSFCLTDRHIYFAIHPQAMKAQLRHLESKRPGFDQEAKQKVAFTNGDPLTYAYLNGPRANGIASAILPYLAPTFLIRLEVEGVKMDSFAIPSAAAISPYFGDSTALVTRQKDGLMFETKNAPPVIVSLALLSIYRAWHSSEFELLEEARRQKGNAGGQAQLGAVVNEVIPAVAESREAEAPIPKSAPSPYRKLAPIFLKALIPDDVRPLIPESAFRQLEEGPSERTIQLREEARQRREDARRKRLERRKAITH